MNLTSRRSVLHIALVHILAGVLLILLTTSTVIAGVNQWTPVGPDGGSVSVLAIDPNASATMYVGTSGSGVFKSTNGGESWVAANHGLENPYISALAIDPHTTTTLYVATLRAVFKSIDGGESWALANNGFPSDLYSPVTTLAIDPTTPTTLYAGTGGQGLFKSTDGATSWTQVTSPSLPDFDIFTVAINPTNPRNIYLGAFHYYQCGRSPCRYPSAFKSADGGTSWQQIEFPTFPYPGFRFIFSSSGTVYVYGGGSIIKSLDSGASWVVVSENVQNISFTALAIVPTAPPTLIAGTPEGVFRSTDDGVTWLPSGLDRVAVNTIAIPPNAPIVLYVGTNDGVSASADSGTTWLPKNSGLRGSSATGLTIDPLIPTTLYAAGRTLFISSNQGEAWTDLPPLPSGLFLRALTVTSTTPRSLFALTNPLETGPTLFKNINNEMSWTPILTDAFVRVLAVDPLPPTTLYAITEQNVENVGFVRKLLKSTNGGAEWAQLNFDFTSTQITALAIHPLQPSLLYAVTSPQGLFQSTDEGVSWQFFSSAVAGGTLAFDPQTPTVMYAYGYPEQFLKSTDGGVTWTSLSDSLPQPDFLGVFPPVSLSTFVIDPRQPTTLYVGINGGGVFRSTDAGKSWAAMNTGLLNKNVIDLDIDPLTGATLYAGTFGGIFAFQVGDESADLSVSQSDFPDPVLTGENLTYTFTVTNNGPSEATGVKILDTLPTDMIRVAATPSQGTCTEQRTIECNLGVLASGQTATLAIVVKPKVSGTTGDTRNVAGVSGTEPDPHTNNNTATVMTTVVAAPGPDLTGYWGRLKQKCKEKAGTQRCTLKGTFFVQNLGTRDAPSSTLSLSFFCGRFCPEVARFTVPVLKPGKQKKLKVKITSEGSQAGGSLNAILDPTNSIVEMDEQNNWVTSAPIQ